MKRIFCIIMAAFAITATASTRASAAETSASGSIDWLTTYVWRGVNLGGNEGVIQPSATINYGAVFFNIWSNYDNELGEHTETDYTVGYSRALTDKVGLEAGYIYYGIDDGAPDIDTEELYVGLGLDIQLSPAVKFYYDINKGEGGFGVFSVGHSFELSDKTEFSISALASYNFGNKVMEVDVDGDGKVDDFSGFYNGEVGAAFLYKLTGKLSITSKVSYSMPLGSDAGYAIRGLSYDGDRHVVYGGINVAIGL